MTPKLLFKLSPLMLTLVAASATAATLSPSIHFSVLDQATLHAEQVDKSALPQRQSIPDQYIVEFSDTPVAATTVASANALKTKLDLASSKVQSRRANLKAAQANAIRSLNRQYPNAKVRRQFNLVFNGMVVQGKDIDMAELKKLPNVKAVYRDEIIQVQMDQSLPIIKAPAVWAELGGRASAGQGIRVAVVDSGIRPENPMFDDTGMAPPANLPSDDYCHTTDPSFCNNKLIVARFYPASSSTASYEYTDSPLGWNGHGTHVAGTAVGMPVEVSYGAQRYDLSGVAPGAYLMAYKALYYNGTTGSGMGSSLIAAVEDAVADGADVINNSWGGGPGGDPNQSAYKQVWENAEAAGVVVVTAAGNDGNGASTIGCPGCVESGITVANTQTGRSFVETVSVDGMGDFNAVESSSPARVADLSDFSAPLVAAASLDSANVEGCSAFASDAFAGSFALISRGTCAFSAKAANVAAAGAKGIIVYNNAAGAPITMAMDDATIPGVMISQDDGATLVAAASTGSLSATLDPALRSYVNEALVDVMNSSSSRGPNGDARFIKPDLAAPGTNILSAYSPDQAGNPDTQFAVLTGTSMASPHVAGAAALVKAAHPDWSPLQIKSALVNTSNGTVTDDDGITPATPFAKGAGRLDVSQAIDSPMALAPVSLAAPSCMSACSFEVNATSLIGQRATWQAELSFDDPNIKGSVATPGHHGPLKAPGQFVLKAGSEASFDVTVDTHLGERDRWYFGTLTLTSPYQALATVHMAIAVYAGNSTDAALLRSSAGTAEAGTPVAGQTVFTNQGITGAATVTVSFPEAVTVSTEPVANVVNGSGSLAFDGATKTATWTGTVNTPEGSLQPGPAWLDSLPSLTDGFNPSFLSCGAACDEGTLTLNLAGLGAYFMGQPISTLTLGTNGYVTFNGATISASYYNDTMPSTKVSGAALAPFWTDLDMTNTGGWYYQFLNDGSADYLVFEWKDVPLWDDASGNTYTFQVLFKLGSDEAYVHYVAMGDIPANVTAGLQNAIGTGSSLYVDGTGSAPASASTYQVSHQEGGSVTLDYAITASAIHAEDLSVDTHQRTAVAIDLGAGLTGSRHVIDSALVSAEKNASAKALLVVTPQGNAASAVILSQPKHGWVTVDNAGIATYTPRGGFIGTDSFGYRLTDEAGSTSSPGVVTISISKDNGAHPGPGHLPPRR
ncbi:MAG: S8 family serine peptidase [Pseudomonadota bacterium]|uniref:S8 family serine peptidase n=1 Tax=Gallaecimonas pentaromativorans TaxID=584787 RepID=UPI00067E9FDE|nr:S8 family serine peptidase [Gallaecimonas pentaromativorans]MED5524728.1 S8 family serine peptidase [Pseudomonadota bacterium]